MDQRKIDVISFKEMLGRHVISDVPINIQQNMQLFLKKMNVVRQCYGKPMFVSSGYRSAMDQLRINPKAPNSRHTHGMAIDIVDLNGELKLWLAQNIDMLEVCGLWLEEFGYTYTWVHFQGEPPKSGKRFFIP